MLSDTMMLGGGRKAAYSIENSLLFRGAQSLSRTPSVAGNLRKSTIRAWVKRAALGTYQYVFCASNNSMENQTTAIYFDAADRLRIYFGNNSGSAGPEWWTGMVFRDPSAWYEIIVAFDTDQPIMADQCKLWVNGELVTDWAAQDPIYQGFDLYVGAVGVVHSFGWGTNTSYHLSGYLAEAVYVDDAALTPDHFGENDPVTGSWRPKKLTDITWGTNGAYLGNPWDAANPGRDSIPGDYTRIYGGVPSAPHGGSAAAINDNDPATRCDVLAFGTVASVPDAILAKIDLGAPQTIRRLDATGAYWTHAVDGTYCRFYVSTDGVSWEQFGTDSSMGIASAPLTATATGEAVARYVAYGLLAGSGYGTYYTISLSELRVFGTGAYSGDDWKATGFTATDVVVDTPTNVYATLNPLTRSTYPALGEGNLSVTGMASGDVSGVAGTLMVPTGKWYWELTLAGVGTYPYVGITTQGGLNQSIAYGSSYEIAKRSADIHAASRLLGTITTDVTGNQTWESGDVLMLALDCDAGKLWFGKNGTWMNNGVPAAGTNPQANWANRNVPIAPFFGGTTGQGDGAVHNFGQRPFTHTPPAGFKPLSTANLRAPSAAAKQPWKYYGSQVVTHDGSGSSFTLGWNPDPANGGSHTLFRVKNLAGGDWYWHDTVRGIDRFLVSNGTAAEYLSTSHLTGLTTTGASLGSGQAAGTYLVEAWRVSPESGFDIVIDDGTGIAKSVPHNNGSPPKFIQRKSRTAAGSYWFVYHAGLNGGSNPEQYYLYLNDTAAQQNLNASRAWNNQAPTSDVFYVGAPGGGFNWTNDSGQSFVSYVWSEVPGFSRFGSYTGNGNADGPVGHVGFTPGSVTIKRAVGGVSNWETSHITRPGYNDASPLLDLHASRGEYSTDPYFRRDLLAGEFKIRNVSYDENASDNTYIFMSWAARCLGGKGVAPATAR